MEIIIKIGILFVVLSSLVAFAIMVFVLPVVLYRRRKVLGQRKKGKSLIEKALISVNFDFTENVFPRKTKEANKVSRIRVIFVLFGALILIIGVAIYTPELAIDS